MPELNEAIGPDLAVKVVEAVGGLDVYVPQPSPVITSLAGDVFNSLVRAFGGQTITLPASRKTAKDQAVELIKQGLRDNEIAARLGITAAYVRKIRGWLKG